MNNNIQIRNDNTSNTLIKIKIDNKNINHKALNQYIKELENLNAKYSIISVNEVV